MSKTFSQGLWTLLLLILYECKYVSHDHSLLLEDGLHGIVSCTACGQQVNHFQKDSIYRHPSLKVLICKVCIDLFIRGFVLCRAHSIWGMQMCTLPENGYYIKEIVLMGLQEVCIIKILEIMIPKIWIRISLVKWDYFSFF